jgi:hypothetical protein
MTSLLVLGSAVLSALSRSFAPVKINDSSKPYIEQDASVKAPTAIDVTLKTVEVPDGTICYVSKESADALKNLGWDVQSNTINGSTMYYYSTNEGSPMIEGAEISKNNISELLDRIKRIQGDVIAKDIAITPDALPSAVNNQVLGYLRSFNKNYVLGVDGACDDDDIAKDLAKGAAWSVLAGLVDPVATRAQDIVLYNWQFLYRYFSQFVEEGDWSDTYHNAYCGPSAEVDKGFPDPILSTEKIDLIHLMASIDCGYKFTDRLGGAFNFIDDGVLMNLSSWAGDLQSTAVAWANSSQISKESDANILSEGSSTPDLLADIDAVNVVSDDLTGVGFLSDALEQYYGSVRNMSVRCSAFVENVSRDCGFESFKNTVYSYLGVVKNDGVFSDSGEYVAVEKKPIYPKYLLLKLGETPDASVRGRVADAFISFVGGYYPGDDK